jgi:putative methionine-R-sulfoxide reductase with GAF domain
VELAGRGAHRRADVAQASQVVVDHLVGLGLTKPSVYLVRGDRIRIQAVSGYQQIYDGMPLGVGVIGQAYVRGEPVVVPDVLADPHYLQANPAVRAEVCVPVRLAGRVVGVVNLESAEPLSDGDVAAVFGAARSFESALERLGHDLTESPSQRLVRHAIRLTTLSTETHIAGEVVAAAADVADMSSATLLMPDATGRFRAVDATGPAGRRARRRPSLHVRDDRRPRAERLLLLHGRRDARDRRRAERAARPRRPGRHRRPARRLGRRPRRPAARRRPPARPEHRDRRAARAARHPRVELPAHRRGGRGAARPRRHGPR